MELETLMVQLGGVWYSLPQLAVRVWSPMKGWGLDKPKDLWSYCPLLKPHIEPPWRFSVTVGTLCH